MSKMIEEPNDVGVPGDPSGIATSAQAGAVFGPDGILGEPAEDPRGTSPPASHRSDTLPRRVGLCQIDQIRGRD